MHKGVAEVAGALPNPPGSLDPDLTWGAASDRDGGRADSAGGVCVCDAQAVRGFLVLLLPLPPSLLLPRPPPLLLRSSFLSFRPTLTPLFPF
jgi:hypothetical protein